MRTETALQLLIRQYIAAAGFHSVAVPNGAVLRGDKVDKAIQWRSLQRQGAMPGFPDLLVYGKRGRIGHIEVKTPTGKQSESQVVAQEWLEGLGHNYAVCRSVNDVTAAFRGWGWI